MGAQFGSYDKNLSALGGREEHSAASAPDLLLYFIAAVALRLRRRLIDECRDQVSNLFCFGSAKLSLELSVASVTLNLAAACDACMCSGACNKNGHCSMR